MKSLLSRTAVSLAGLIAICLTVRSTQPGPEQTVTSNVVSAANLFLSTLDDKQRKAVLFSFDDQEQRKRWSNFPTGFVPRAGINLKDMSAAQQAAAMDLLATVLSPKGFEKVNQIREADDDFKLNGSRRGPPGGRPPAGNGGPPPQFGGPRSNPGDGAMFGGAMFGKDLYYISFLGNPSTTTPWMLQFGGHHLALNITIDSSKEVMTPSLTGAQPATFKLNGQTIRPIGRESDKGLALIQSLDSQQSRQAVLGYRVPDLILGPGQDGKKIAPEGLKASAMTEQQRALLLDLIAEWTGIMNQTAASTRMAELKTDLNETWFAWSGPTQFKPGDNITSYYRIQGPHLVIEYAPQVDDPTNHVHTIYRDPTNDYGRQFTSQ